MSVCCNSHVLQGCCRFSYVTNSVVQLSTFPIRLHLQLCYSTVAASQALISNVWCFGFLGNQIEGIIFDKSPHGGRNSKQLILF